MALRYSHSSVNSTISILPSTPETAFTKLFHATLLSLVSVKYDHGGLNRDGFLTALVLTPLAVAETLDKRPSALYLRVSSVQVTTVREGFVSVLHPRLPADVGALFVGMFCACADGSANAALGKSEIMAVEQIVCNISLRLLLLLVDCCI